MSIDPALMKRVNAVLAERDARPRPQPRAEAESGQVGLRVTAQADGAPTEVLIYDEIGFWGVMASDVVAALPDEGDLHVRINSPGGNVFDGIAIFNRLVDHPGKVTVTVDGLAASAASFIAMAGDRIVMNRHAQLMIHNASGMCIGNAVDMRDLADLLDKVSGTIAAIYADRTGTTPEFWQTAMTAETWYTPAEAVAAGLVDEATPGHRRGADEDAPAVAPAAATWDLTVFQYAGREEAPAPALPAAAGQPLSGGVVLEGEHGPELGRLIVEALRSSGCVVRPPSNTASGVHRTATENSSWDGPGAVAAMPEEAATLRYCHAWRDPNGDSDAKATYKFPHHRKDGGPANLAACRNGLARLTSADIPEAERAGVEAHLRAHLADGGSDDDSGDAEDHQHDQIHAGTEPATEDAPPIEAGDGWDATTAHLLTEEDPFKRLAEAL